MGSALLCNLKALKLTTPEPVGISKNSPLTSSRNPPLRPATFQPQRLSKPQHPTSTRNSHRYLSGRQLPARFVAASCAEVPSLARINSTCGRGASQDAKVTLVTSVMCQAVVLRHRWLSVPPGTSFRMRCDFLLKQNKSHT